MIAERRIFLQERVGQLDNMAIKYTKKTSYDELVFL